MKHKTPNTKHNSVAQRTLYTLNYKQTSSSPQKKAGLNAGFLVTVPYRHFLLGGVLTLSYGDRW